MKEEYDFSQGKRGSVVPLSPNKTRITIRLDTDIVNWFRSRPNYLRTRSSTTTRPLRSCNSRRCWWDQALLTSDWHLKKNWLRITVY